MLPSLRCNREAREERRGLGSPLGGKVKVQENSRMGAETSNVRMDGNCIFNNLGLVSW